MSALELFVSTLTDEEKDKLRSGIYGIELSSEEKEEGGNRDEIS